MNVRRRLATLLVGVGLLALLAAACGSSAEVSGGDGSDSTSSTLNEVHPVRPTQGVSVEQASALRSGFAPGVVEMFEFSEDAEALESRVDATVVGRFSGYELNPKSDAVDLSTPGYAGTAGVLRVYFELDRSLGGRAREVREAPGRPGEGLIAVDLPYWMPEEHRPEHFKQLDVLEGVRFLLFLVDGTIDSKVTGAYQLWEDPFAALAEGVDGRTVRVLHDTDLILRDAIERGAKEHPEASLPPESELGPPPPDILTPLEGRPFDDVADELQQDG